MPFVQLRSTIRSVRATITATEPDSRDKVTRRDHAYLVMALRYEAPTEPARRFGLDGVQDVVVGRGDGDARQALEEGRMCLRVDIRDPRMSGEHCKLTRDGKSWVAVDMSSRNGTFVNGTKVERRVLADGDLIELGRAFSGANEDRLGLVRAADGGTLFLDEVGATGAVCSRRVAS